MIKTAGQVPPQHQAAVGSAVRPFFPNYSFPKRKGRCLWHLYPPSDPAPQDEARVNADMCVQGARWDCVTSKELENSPDSRLL